MNPSPQPFTINWRAIPFDTTQTATLFTNRGSLDSACRLHAAGAISERDFRWYIFFWTWSVPRFSDNFSAATKQLRCIKAISIDGLERRFSRCQRLYARWCEHRFSAYTSLNTQV